MKSLLILAFLFCSSSMLLSQFDVVWEKSFGGEDTEQINHLLQTRDGGFLASGYTQDGSFLGSANAYLLRLTKDGDSIWEGIYGGTDFDQVQAVIEVEDGFVFAGLTRSNDGDVSNPLGSIDAWIVKVDHFGNLIWEKSYGGEGIDVANDLIETNDGGILVIGESNSDDAGLSLDGSTDMMLIKINVDGNLEWINSYDKNNIVDSGTIIIQNDDGTFMIGGGTASCEFSQSSVPCVADYWLIKINAEGDIIWDRTYGEVTADDLYLSSLKLIPGIGYVLAGIRGEDAWMLSTDLQGNLLWDKIIGGVGVEAVYDVTVTEYNHIIGVGYSTSDESGALMDDADRLVFELDSEGQLLWVDLIGEPDNDEYAWAIEPTSDGCYILAGRDKFFINDSQASIVKLRPRSTSTSWLDPISTLGLYPNPAHDKITINVGPQQIGNSFTICNANGQIIRHGIIKEKLTTVSIHNFPVGIYNLKLSDSHLTEKFIKY